MASIMMHVLLDIRAVLSCVVKSHKVAFTRILSLGEGGWGGGHHSVCCVERLATRKPFSLTASLFLLFVKVSCLKIFNYVCPSELHPLMGSVERSLLP